MKKKLKSIEEDIRELETSIFSLNVNLAQIEKALPKVEIPETDLVQELDTLMGFLREKGEDTGALAQKQSAIAESLEMVKRFVSSLSAYVETVKELRGSVLQMNELFDSFKKLVVERSNKQTITMEKYRILSHLGEMDSKVLTLLLSGVKFDSEFLEEVSSLRKDILSDKKIDITELQKRFNRLFKIFADVFEDSSRQLKDYQKEAKKIVQNMRDVVWM